MTAGTAWVRRLTDVRQLDLHMRPSESHLDETLALEVLARPLGLSEATKRIARPCLSQQSRQAELRKDTAVGEPRDGGDVVAFEGKRE